MNTDELLDYVNSSLRSLLVEGTIPHPEGKTIREQVPEGKFKEFLELLNQFEYKTNECKDSARKCQEQQRTYELLLENINGAFYRCENALNWPFLDVSRQIVNITGYHAEEFIQRKIFYGDLIVKEHQQQVWDRVQEGVNNKTNFRLIYAINHKDGKKRWVWEQGKGVYDEKGNLRFLEGFITEITTQITQELDLLTTSSKLESVNKMIVERELRIVELKDLLKMMKAEVKEGF